jgi:hypothetical protein
MRHDLSMLIVRDAYLDVIYKVRGFENEGVNESFWPTPESKRNCVS